MTRWNQNPFVVVLACIGGALVVFVLGASVVLATGNSVPAALWAVGGAAIGILAGVLLPRTGPVNGTPDSRATPEDPSPSRWDGEQPHAAGSAHTEDEGDAGASAAEQGSTPSPAVAGPALPPAQQGTDLR